MSQSEQTPPAPTPTLAQAEQAVLQARRRGDAAALAEALVDYANALALVARFADARDALDEAADNYRALRRTEDEATSTLFAASFARLSLDYEGVYKRGAYAIALLPPQHPIAQSAYLEMAEMAMVTGDAERAAQFYDRALQIAQANDTPPADLASLYGKRARAYVGAGNPDAARDDLATAVGLLHQVGSQARVVLAAVELATLLANVGAYDDSIAYVDDAEAIAAEVLADPPDDETAQDMLRALADISLVRASVALFQQDLQTGFEQAEIARQRALDAVHPVAYMSAVFNLARLYDAFGDRVNAYAILATGYVTLGDLLGEDTARASFEPSFSHLRERWGEDAYAAVRAEYERQRRESQG